MVLCTRLEVCERYSNIIDRTQLILIRWVGLTGEIKSFIWKVRLNKIPSKMALRDRGVCMDFKECSLCFGHNESSDHFLLNCQFATKVWKNISRWCGQTIPLNGSLRDCIDSHSVMNGTKDLKNKMEIILMATV